MFYVGYYIAIVAITSLLVFAGVMFIDKIHHYLKTACGALLYYCCHLNMFPLYYLYSNHHWNMFQHLTHPNNTQPNPQKIPKKNSTNPCVSCQIFVFSTQHPIPHTDPRGRTHRPHGRATHRVHRRHGRDRWGHWTYRDNWLDHKWLVSWWTIHLWDLMGFNRPNGFWGYL